MEESERIIGEYEAQVSEKKGFNLSAFKALKLEFADEEIQLDDKIKAIEEKLRKQEKVFKKSEEDFNLLCEENKVPSLKISSNYTKIERILYKPYVPKVPEPEIPFSQEKCVGTDQIQTSNGNIQTDLKAIDEKTEQTDPEPIKQTSETGINTDTKEIIEKDCQTELEPIKPILTEVGCQTDPVREETSKREKPAFRENPFKAIFAEFGIKRKQKHNFELEIDGVLLIPPRIEEAAEETRELTQEGAVLNPFDFLSQYLDKITPKENLPQSDSPKLSFKSNSKKSRKSSFGISDDGKKVLKKSNSVSLGSIAGKK